MFESDERRSNWEGKINEVRKFALHNNKWPSTISDDKEEKRIAKWWSKQKSAYNKYRKGKQTHGMNGERFDIIKNLIDIFQELERDAGWKERFNSVREKAKNDGKLWPYADEEHIKIIKWWNQQKTFYRQWRKGFVNGGMSENRARMIEDVLIDLRHNLADEDTPTGSRLGYKYEDD